VTGGASLIAEVIGYFWGVGPMACVFGSPQTAGEVEAHGLAVVVGVVLIRAAALIDPTLVACGRAEQPPPAGCNRAFFRRFDRLAVGWVTTSLHLLFAALHAKAGAQRPQVCCDPPRYAAKAHRSCLRCAEGLRVSEVQP